MPCNLVIIVLLKTKNENICIAILGTTSLANPISLGLAFSLFISLLFIALIRHSQNTLKPSATLKSPEWPTEINQMILKELIVAYR
ncbi:hypothetical protein YERSI8AC_250160 [Enterobacterales bacterium 8AC]|nr:hypothetical protein YERSI8AC_250160 [Enterobacterales bacterium 8AC]